MGVDLGPKPADKCSHALAVALTADAAATKANVPHATLIRNDDRHIWMRGMLNHDDHDG